MMAKYAIKVWTRFPAEIDIASEFRYRDPVLDASPSLSVKASRVRPSTRWLR